MKASLYRYPHPLDSTRFIYVGQEKYDTKRPRDQKHRLGISDFGRRFRELFPDATLPEPIAEQVEVQDFLHLNMLETGWIYQFGTLKRDYPEGMNVCLPGSQDYLNLGKIGDREGKRRSGLNAVKTGQLSRASERIDLESLRKRTAKMGKKYGPIQGLKNVEAGHIARMHEKLTPSVLFAAGQKSGRLTKENGTGIFSLTTQQRVANARKNVAAKVGVHAPNYDRSKGGRAAARNPENRKIWREHGKKLGRHMVESGQLAKARESCDYKEMGRLAGRTEGAAKGRDIARHNRWHVNRGIVNPKCALCQAPLYSGT